ncbi:amidohydrolase family protein [bacterium]|nr:amidohydrolase family protein [bacterium]
MHQTPAAYRAKWILPVARPPIANGVVYCRSGKIEQIGEHIDLPNAQIHDLGDVAIIPGLVNAHTHLEFSDLDQPLGDPSLGFPKWIEAVISHRHTHSSPADKPTAIKKGISESLQSGVVAVGEIATTPWTHESYDERIHGIVFHEQLGNNPLETHSKTSEIETRVGDLANPNWQAGISPHAPYSTSLNLFQSLVSLAANNNTRVAMHLAETLEEVEFIETGKGPFAEMLEQLGVPFSRSGQIKTEDYLKQLAAVNALIIHGNFLNIDELEMIAGFDNQSIVFCPRTHKYFGHPEYPLRTMLDLGINVAVGTDSRASNPDLNLFAELKQIFATKNDIRPEEILRMGTQSGASALGCETLFGGLAPGQSGQFCVVSQLPNPDKPLESIFAPESRCQPVSVYENSAS